MGGKCQFVVVDEKKLIAPYLYLGKIIFYPLNYLTICLESDILLPPKYLTLTFNPYEMHFCNDPNY